MKIVETKHELVIDPLTGETCDYTINIYDTGAIEKFDSRFPPVVVKPPILTEDQEIMREMETNTEMLLALAELGGGGLKPSMTFVKPSTERRAA